MDGAIHRAGGPTILADCIVRFPSGLATGQAGWTTAGELPARWVIHVVGPVYTREDATKRHQLSSCYTNALRMADELGARSVAFPLVSAGVYGWPLADAANVAISALGSVATHVEEARVVAYGPAAYEALATASEAAG